MLRRSDAVFSHVSMMESQMTQYRMENSENPSSVCEELCDARYSSTDKDVCD